KQRGLLGALAGESDFAGSLADVKRVEFFQRISHPIGPNLSRTADIDDAEFAPFKEILRANDFGIRRKRQGGLYGGSAPHNHAVYMVVRQGDFSRHKYLIKQEFCS